MSNQCRINIECMPKTTCDTTCGTFHVSICWASYEYLHNCNVGIVLALHQPTFPARKDATTVPLADSALCTNGPRIRFGCTLPIGPLHMRKVLRFGCMFRGYSASCRHYQREGLANVRRRARARTLPRLSKKWQRNHVYATAPVT